MRITVHVSEKIGKEVQRLAEDEKKSVSSVVAQSIEFFIDEKRRRQLGITTSTVTRAVARQEG
jgi:predicted transcriptional regulator